MTAIVPIVLAAGASSRMGTPKATVLLGGKTALAHVLGACEERGLAAPIVVAGAHPEAVRSAASANPLARVIVNEQWARGRTTSIRAGVAALPADAEAFLVWPVDAPLAGVALGPLLQAYARRAPRERAWVPSCAGRRGHPLLLARSVGRELAALGDDEPARKVVHALAERGELVHVVVEDELVLLDANTPEELARLEARLR